MLQGFILFIAIVYSLINLVVDVSYGVIDPRVTGDRMRPMRMGTP